MSVRIKDNSRAFLAKVKSNNLAALNEIGSFSKGKMDTLAAKDTGYMVSRNRYDVQGNKVTLSNDCDYAIHQEYGTYKMRAHPFIRPAAFNYHSEVINILIKNLSRGM